MKMKYRLSMLLLAVVSVFRLGAREEVINEASTVGTHANGIVTRSAEEAIATRHLLVKKGTADNEVLICGATDRPLGPCLDEPAIDQGAAVALLGVAPGTKKLRAAKAIGVGDKLWTAAGGKVTDTYGAGAFFVGVALTAAGADGDLIEVADTFPMLDGSGTTL